MDKSGRTRIDQLAIVQFRAAATIAQRTIDPKTRLMARVTDTEQIVYVIDDDPTVLASLDALFRAAGLHAALFGSAEAFLAAERPDLAGCLVLDVGLPQRNGLDFQRELKGLGIHFAGCFHHRLRRCGDVGPRDARRRDRFLRPRRNHHQGSSRPSAAK